MTRGKMRVMKECCPQSSNIRYRYVESSLKTDMFAQGLLYWKPTCNQYGKTIHAPDIVLHAIKSEDVCHMEQNFSDYT